MPRRADILTAQGLNTVFNGAGINRFIQTPSGVLYCVYIDTASDVVFRKSLDGGFTWGAVVTVFGGTVTNLATYYERWSGINGGLIHCAYTESVTDETRYRTIDTENSDTLSTETVIFPGATTGTIGHLSIVRAVGGNVYCKTVIDAGAEGGFYRLANANVPNGAWDAARTVDEAIATGDQMILLPDYDAADTQDIMAVFWDASANEISRKLYDDSGDSWSETSISGSMTDLPATTAFPNFDVAHDIANTRHILVAWTNTDLVNEDLRCWIIDAGTITEVTNVILNSVDDQRLCQITLDPVTGYWYVYYTGKSDGSEEVGTSVNVYCKVSQDSGTTWGDEILLSTFPRNIAWLSSISRLLAPIAMPPPVQYFHNSGPTELFTNVSMRQPLAEISM